MMPKRKFDPNIIVAASAVFISVCALIVSIVQTNLQTRQQKAASWPYLEVNYNIIDNQFYISVQNKGVGPAVIKEVSLQYQDNEYDDMVSLAREITTKQDTFLAYYWDPLDKRVIAPQEEIRHLLLPNKEDALLFYKVAEKVHLRIVYASVFDELWAVAENKEVIQLKRLKDFERWNPYQ